MTCILWIQKMKSIAEYCKQAKAMMMLMNKALYTLELQKKTLSYNKW